MTPGGHTSAPPPLILSKSLVEFGTKIVPKTGPKCKKDQCSHGRCIKLLINFHTKTRKLKAYIIMNSIRYIIVLTGTKNPSRFMIISYFDVNTKNINNLTYKELDHCNFMLKEVVSAFVPTGM